MSTLHPDLQSSDPHTRVWEHLLCDRSKVKVKGDQPLARLKCGEPAMCGISLFHTVSQGRWGPGLDTNAAPPPFAFQNCAHDTVPWTPLPTHWCSPSLPFWPRTPAAVLAASTRQAGGPLAWAALTRARKARVPAALQRLKPMVMDPRAARTGSPQVWGRRRNRRTGQPDCVGMCGERHGPSCGGSWTASTSTEAS